MIWRYGYGRTGAGNTNGSNINDNNQILEGKQLILATKAFAVEDRRKSWVLTISTLFILIGLLAMTVIAPIWPLKLLLSLVAGLVMVRMFIIYHDFQHHTIFKGSKLANAILTIYGMYVLVPASIWKRSHDYHHNHNSKLFSASIGSYPIATRCKYNEMCAKDRRIYLAIRHPLTILFGYFSMFIFGMCVSSLVSAPKKHMDSLLTLIIHFTISILVFYFAGWQVWLFTIFIPIFFACAMGAYLFYAQHNFPDTKFADNKAWKYENAALESSSYMKMHPIMHWFTGNIGYHHIHHLNSKIPFYRLPEAMAAMPELQYAKTTSLKPRDIIACFRLKVWDPQAEKMIGFKELRQD